MVLVVLGVFIAIGLAMYMIVEGIRWIIRKVHMI
jgi:hypothetical protein